jgi:MYXO-CTERM domain-containing protein
VRGTRIDGTGGKPLDDPAIDFGAGVTPAVAAAGSDYLVAWINPSAAYTLGRRFVRGADGSLGAVLPTVLSRSSSETGTDQFQTRALRLVYNGANFCLAWIWKTELRGVRLDSSGAALDSTYLRLINGLDFDSYALLADRAPTPDMRTFVVAASTQSGSFANPATVAVRRLRSQSGALIDLTSGGMGDRVTGATGAGDKMVIEYFIRANYPTESFNTVQPIDGTVVDAQSKFELTGSTADVESLWYDGVSFLQMIDSNYALSARRYTNDLTALESATPVTGTSISVSLAQDAFDHAVIGNSSGRSLVAFQQVDTVRSGTTLKGVFLDNDGQPAPATGTGGSSGATGSVGSGGIGTGAIGGAVGSGLPTTFDGGSAGEPNEAGAAGLAADGISAASGGKSGQGGLGTSASGTSAGDAPLDDTAGEPTGGSSSPSKSVSGCGCRVGTAPTDGRGLGLSLVGLCSVLARRRRRGAPKQRD